MIPAQKCWKNVCLTTPLVIVLPSTFWESFSKVSALLTCTMQEIATMRTTSLLLRVAACCLHLSGPLQAG